MDMSGYKKEFVSEAHDHIDTLNDNLILLEKSSDDPEVIQKLFRAFHTLKGNSAAMGYKKFSELAHSLEDVLAKIRDKELNVTQEVMDVIFDGCDILEKGLEQISADTPENIDSDNVIITVKSILGIKDEKIEVIIPKKLQFSTSEKSTVEQASAKGLKNIFRIIILFDEKNVLKTAKSMLIVKGIEKDNKDSFIIFRSIPKIEEVRAGKVGAEVEIDVATSKIKDEVDKIINKVSGLKGLFILSADEEYSDGVDNANPQVEHVPVPVQPVPAIVPAATTDTATNASSGTAVPTNNAAVISANVSPTPHASTSSVASSSAALESKAVKQIQSIKVDMERLDKLMNLVGELLISNMRLADVTAKKDMVMLKTVLSETERQVLDLKDEVMKIRMLPIGNIFNRFPRMVRDLAAKENKKINFIVEGSELELDRTVLDQIGDPLVHMLRNSIDHGVESPDERLNAGKSAEGTIRLIARREKNTAIVEVVDDGAGVDSEKVKDSCIKKGVLTVEEASKLSSKELQMLIFRAKISTNTVVTEVSGRGVGMDVVSSTMKQLGGSFSMDSEIGKGTSIKLHLPLTVAIITAFLVRVENAVYAIPLNTIDLTLELSKSNIKTINGNDVFILREKEIPLLYLHKLLGSVAPTDNRKGLLVVVVNHIDGPIGFVVDEIISQQQILIKSLQDIVKGTKGCSGATILGDGSVALILDINTLVDARVRTTQF